jgi:DNA-directed RNA polymerase subunit RPC12/RpoP
LSNAAAGRVRGASPLTGEVIARVEKSCPQCGFLNRVAGGEAGHVVRCWRCGNDLVLAREGAAPAKGPACPYCRVGLVPWADPYAAAFGRHSFRCPSCGELFSEAEPGEQAVIGRPFALGSD